MRIKKQPIIIITTLIFCFLITWSLSAKTLKGTVFHDLNKNLKFDKGEPGIPNVLVSNQRDVVKTNKKGQYKIKVYDECVFFITKPSGYQTTIDENNLPQFYYIHQPKGSPQLKYQIVNPTGKLPKKLNFPLFRIAEPDTFDVLVFGDPQPRDNQEISYIRDDVIAELIGTKATLGITLGDIMYDNLSLYNRYNKVVSQIGIPFYNVAGNHDRNYDASDDTHSLETFKSYFGPNYYSFEYGKVHFIVLDDVVHFFEKDKPKYKGKLTEKQLEWLKNDISLVDSEFLIVFTMHIPFFYNEENKQPSLNLEGGTELLEIVKDRKHLLALSAHTHTIQHNYIGKELGFSGEKPFHHIICGAVCGSWWSGNMDERGIPIADMRDGGPNGYYIFTFKGNQFSEIYKPASHEINFQMRISSPQGTILKNKISETKIVVNIFDGSERSKVTYKIDSFPEKEMTPTYMKDPYLAELYRQTETVIERPIKPLVSSHIWTAPLLEDLKSGAHKIVVTTQDQFGHIFKTAKIFEIE